MEPHHNNLLKQKIIDILKTCYDPEIPVDIYELGLIYDIEIGPDQSVQIKMTLTSPGCPVAGALVNEVKEKIAQIETVSDCNVELVWNPPWDKHKMSEEAKLKLNLF